MTGNTKSDLDYDKPKARMCWAFSDNRCSSFAPGAFSKRVGIYPRRPAGPLLMFLTVSGGSGLSVEPRSTEQGPATRLHSGVV